MKRTLIVTLSVLLTGCGPGEPMFQGKRFSAWLKDLKNHPSATERMRAAHAIGQMGSEARAAIPDLINALKDDSPLVRWAAAESLGAFGAESKAAVPSLRDIVKKDNYEPARAAAEASLQRIDPAGTVETARP
jgi:HEAT repeat protein